MEQLVEGHFHQSLAVYIIAIPDTDSPGLPLPRQMKFSDISSHVDQLLLSNQFTLNACLFASHC